MSTEHDLRPCKYCGAQPHVDCYEAPTSLPVVQFLCPECGEGVHADSYALAAATWNAMNLPEEKS